MQTPIRAVPALLALVWATHARAQTMPPPPGDASDSLETFVPADADDTEAITPPGDASGGDGGGDTGAPCDDVADPTCRIPCLVTCDVNGVCTGPCHDGDACTQDVCLRDGRCLWEDVVCDDHNECTDDTCDAAVGCVFDPVEGGTPCDDGDLCTQDDHCEGGSCVSTPIDCDDGVDCTLDTCDPATGECASTASDGMCQDQDTNPCTEARCVVEQGGCVTKARDGQPCQDGDLCTMNDTCQGTTCVGGPQRSCDDAQICTDDDCDPATGECTFVDAEGACEECRGGPPGGSASASFSAELPVSGQCPVLGGTWGVDIKLEGSVSGEAKPCPDCSAEGKVAAELTADVSLCKGNKFTLSGGGDYTLAKRWCVACDQADCELFCGPEYCQNESFSGFAGIAVSRNYGFQWSWKAGGGRWLPTISFGVDCGVTVTGSIKGTGTYDEVEDGGCKPCEQCQTIGGRVDASVTGEGGCSIDFSVAGYGGTLGCPKCASLELTLGAGASKKSGACGDRWCFEGTLGAAAKAWTPCWSVGWGWFKVALKCQAGVSGQCTAANCGDSGCTGDAWAECNVWRGGCE